jgi:hypothetical protein
MYRKAHPGGGHDAASRIGPPHDGPDRDAAAGPSYVEAVLFGRRRMMSGAQSPAFQPCKTHPQPQVTAEGEPVLHASKKGTEPCAS